MNNQVILSALKSELSAKQSQINNFETEVHDPKVAEITGQIVEWFKSNVQDTLPKITADATTIKIASYASRWECVTLSIDSRWRDEDKSVRISTNGHNVKSDEENELLDIILAGKVAQKFRAIEYEFLNTWNPMFVEAREPLNEMRSTVWELERTIRQVESDMEVLAKGTYKQVGFSCKLNPKKEIKNRWSEEPTTIEDVAHEIKLQIGRSKWDYLYVGSFKVKAINKYKCTLEIETNHSKDREVTVTANQYNNFVEDVYSWQNGGSDRQNQRELESFEKYCVPKNAKTETV